MINGIGPFRAAQLIAKSARPAIVRQSSGPITNVAIDVSFISKPIKIRNAYTDIVDNFIKQICKH